MDLSMDNFFKNVCKDIMVVLCNTQLLLNKAKRIRHEVFCIENGYEATNPEQMEQDEFDGLSHHLLAVDRNTGVPVATMRLIVSRELPLHAYVADNHILKSTILSEGNISEFSRLAVISTYRSSYIAKASGALFLAAGYMAVKLGFSTVGGIMQKSLIRVLGRAGVKCTKITEDFEHRGKRAVYVMTSCDFIGFWSAYTSFDSTKIDEHFEQLGDLTPFLAKQIISNSIPEFTTNNKQLRIGI